MIAIPGTVGGGTDGETGCAAERHGLQSDDEAGKVRIAEAPGGVGRLKGGGDAGEIVQPLGEGAALDTREKMPVDRPATCQLNHRLVWETAALQRHQLVRLKQIVAHAGSAGG
ncbi:MAG: hypothetical protein MUF04_09375, partial [Akkermansiaceae bacterium]|nr:hypothetical protein [Akkermansiaceae bacterium]